ncbi:MAG: hypothetical protein MRY83_19825 [Flavobacteriales bacterium]|nr:hypothetical protein [Flavobacteriales bacterium]
MRPLPEGWHYHPGLELKEITSICENFELTLPLDFLEFFRFSNGGEGFLKNGEYLSVWKLEEIKQLNDDYEIQKWLNDQKVFGFGSNGGRRVLYI